MTQFNISREIDASVGEVFAAFADTERLARWWGPSGFTNSFDVCEFESGGRWVYTMHDSEGKDYPNESVFREVVPERRVVIEHIVLPKYILTITFAENDGKTTVTWEQDFENKVFAAKMKDFLESANEQNLDRLTAEVIGAV